VQRERARWPPRTPGHTLGHPHVGGEAVDVSDTLRLALADRYTIERELGQGGMATVYLAEDLRHHRQVALKVLRQELTAALGAERFHREIQIAAKLQHPNILPLLDSGEAGGLLYYAMPYVEGQSLRERLAREGALPVPDTVRILRDVVDALTEAHAHGVVHRDIKPENILLRGRHALVTDFGVAKAVSEATGRQTLTTAGVALGTPAYMAPEQASADPHLDHRVDIYAVGAVAYELLTGRPVFMGTTPQMVLSAHVTEAPQAITKFREAVPRALDALVMRCLAKQPADRWQSAEELLPQLEALATPSGGITPTDTRPVSAALRRWRRHVPVVAGIAVAVVALGFIGVILRHSRGSAAGAADLREPILVLPFDTHVTSASLKDVGELAADRIESGIEEAGLGAVKPRRAVLGTSQSGPATPELLSRIAKSSGAATLVTGVIYQRGDTLEVQSQLLRARDLKTIFSLPAERGPATDPGRAVDAAKERILGAAAFYLSPDFRNINATLYRPPSSLALFRLFARAFQLFFKYNYADAIPVFQEILRRDSTQFATAEFLMTANWNLGRQRQVDSILRVMETRRARLTPGEAVLLDVAQTWRRSPEEEYSATMAAFRVDSQFWAYNALRAAVVANHISEAPRFYRLRDTTSGLGRVWQAWYGYEAFALHGLGRYDEELALARDARRRDPASLAHAEAEARALVALGRMAELNQLLTASRALPDYRAPGYLMHQVATELFEHRTKDEFLRMEEQALAWHQALPVQQRKDVEVQSRMAAENYYLGRYAEAGRLYADLARQFPDNSFYVNAGARIAAAQGDTAVALRRVEALRADTASNNGLDIARILALLGRKEEAVAALRDYLNHGGRYQLGWHATALELATLRDYPPFKALVALKE